MKNNSTVPQSKGCSKEKCQSDHVYCIKVGINNYMPTRNPITGTGLNGDGLGVLKPIKPKIQANSKDKSEDAASRTATNKSSSSSDVDCANVGPVPAQNSVYDQSDKHHVNIQSRADTGTNPERPFSFNNMRHDSNAFQSSNCSQGTSVNISAQNPIGDFGIQGDGSGSLRQMIPRIRGNPLTGEGYKPGTQDYIGPVGMNSHETINISTVNNGNRVPPGGYSSGLW
ncbi:microtubule-associated protein Jupiter isoform X2 [Drosophila grimshawi]|uniref:microtubule-associated protein Jupiter isoform X2 n=1 Tax=Drosophila grimshawi TaxID=7222 RepID=UPI000C86ECDF|nr:microtubule-associated protein Jupiter isoform X2 [Drosophila grimshawi]